MKKISRAINKVLNHFGYGVVSRQYINEPSRWTMGAALARLQAWGISPRSVIDLGAASGNWSKACHEVFPECDYLLVEPLEERETILKQLLILHPRWRYALAVAGPEEGSIEFSVSEPLDGSGVYGKNSQPGRLVSQQTLDNMVLEHQLQPPFLVKFDTHGYEIPILEGASKVLEQACALIIEAYAFKISPTCVPFWELCRYLEERGFRPADMADPFHRQRDGALWHMDLFFIRSDEPRMQIPAYA